MIIKGYIPEEQDRVIKTIAVWFDLSWRCYAIQHLNAAGDQIGDCEYEANKRDAARSVAGYMEKYPCVKFEMTKTIKQELKGIAK